jgi:hypothetical protein
MIDNTYEIEWQKQWIEKFPSTRSSLSAFYQCLYTIAVIGSELGSVLIDIFAACVISFDAYFIIRPTTCFFSGIIVK